MRRTILLLIVVLAIVSIGLADLKSEASANQSIINESIRSAGLLWNAGLSEEFIEKYEAFNLNSLEELFSRLSGYVFLPGEVQLKIDEYVKKIYEQGLKGKVTIDGMTTTDDLIMASYVFLQPETVPDDTFYRIEPVRDQYYHGSCWAFATSGSFESARAVQELGEIDGNADNIFDYSERWCAYHNIDWDVYYATGYEYVQDRNSLEGGNSYFAMYNAVRYGMMEEQYAPYSEVFMVTDEVIPLPPSAYGAPRVRSSKTIMIPSAYTFKDLGYTYEQYLDIIQLAIAEYGSLAVSFYVPSDLYYYEKGIYTPSPGAYNTGGHAVTLVGWAKAEDLDDIVLAGKINPDAAPVIEEEIESYEYYDPTLDATFVADMFWIIKNSWGYSWGDGGYFVVPVITEEQYNSEEIGWWQIESRSMFVPVFDTLEEHAADDLVINGDGVVNLQDFSALVNYIGSEDEEIIAKCDLSYPKDGVINGEDVAAWIYLYNNR